MSELTVSQRILLAAAAERESGQILPLPADFKGNKATSVRIINSLLKHGWVAEQAATTEDTVWRKAKDGKRWAVVLTSSGRKAAKPTLPQAKRAAAPRKAPDPKAAKSAPEKMPAQRGRGSSKLDQLADLLRRKGGATIQDAMNATGWQAHSIRGAISGALKKKLRLAVTAETVEGRGRVYRIAGRG